MFALFKLRNARTSNKSGTKVKTPISSYAFIEVKNQQCAHAYGKDKSPGFLQLLEDETLFFCWINLK